MWLDSVADRRTILCVLDPAPSNGDELLRRVLTDFGLLRPGAQSVPEVSSVQMMQVLQRFLASLRTIKARAFIVIENAQAADPPTRLEIQRLSDLDPAVLEILLVTPTNPVRLITTQKMLVATAAALVAAAGWLWIAQPPRAPALEPKTAPAAVEPRPDRQEKAAAGAGAPVANLVRTFRVRVGAFRDPAGADATVARVRAMRLPVALTVGSTGLRHITVGPYVLRAEASTAQRELREAGFVDSVLTDVPPSGGDVSAADRRMLARAAELAEKHDVRAIETLRDTWRASSANGPTTGAAMAAVLDQYLDAARRAQLLEDRQLLIRDTQKTAR